MPTQLPVSSPGDAVLRESEERYRLISSLVADFAYSFTVDDNGVLTRDWASDGFARIGGGPHGTLAEPGNLFGPVHPDDVPAIADALRRAVDTPSLQTVEYRVPPPDKGDGPVRWFRHRFTGMHSAGSPRVRHIIGAGHDITEGKVLEEQFRQAQKMEAIGRLAGGVAHDFNNLLQSILGYADLLLAVTPPGDERHQDLLDIRECSLKASALTGQLLTFSRRQVVERKIVDLNALLSDAERMLQRVLGEDVTLHTALLADLPRVRVDPHAIEQAVMNLVVNARDAMPHGGRITVGTAVVTLGREESRCVPESRVGRFVCLSVTDTGCGMPAETMKHLFEPFFTTKAKGHGTGLGLAMVYGLMKQHDGWVSVYSESGRGSTFKLYFPAQDGLEKLSQARNGAQASRTSGGGQHILVVEDEEALRDLAARLLRRGGYRVTTAATGTAAIAAAKAEPMDLIFSDVVLPDLGGVDVVEMLTPLVPGIRFLFTSGYTDDRSRWPWIRERGYPFIQKPYLMDDLLEAVQTVLAAPSPRR